MRKFDRRYEKLIDACDRLKDEKQSDIRRTGSKRGKKNYKKLDNRIKRKFIEIKKICTNVKTNRFRKAPDINFEEDLGI